VVYIVHYSHKSGCCIRSMAPWITVLSQHTVFTKRVIITNLLLCDIPWNKAPCTGPRHIWHTVPFLWPREHRQQSSGLISLATVCYGYSCWRWLLLLFLFFLKSSNITSFRTWFRGCVSNQNFTDDFLLKFYLFFSGHCSRPTIVCLV